MPNKLLHKLVLLILAATALSGCGAMAADYQIHDRPTPPTTDDRSWLCHEQEKLLDQFIAQGRTDKMREYQRYLTQNRCYG